MIHHLYINFDAKDCEVWYFESVIKCICWKGQVLEVNYSVKSLWLRCEFWFFFFKFLPLLLVKSTSSSWQSKVKIACINYLNMEQNLTVGVPFFLYNSSTLEAQDSNLLLVPIFLILALHFLNSCFNCLKSKDSIMRTFSVGPNN